MARRASKKEKEKHDPLSAETVEGMKVTKIGRGHYNCQSSSDPSHWWAIDILDNDGLGSCTCPDFTFRCYPRWKSSRKLYDSFRCRHLRKVRGFVLDAILSGYVKKEKAG